MLQPPITVITPSFNQAQYLEETITSVLDQNYPNLEYMVIDGGSSDGSADIIRKYEKHLAWWVSEKDNGQTHAINKGLRKATGKIFNWINSDDKLTPDSLETVAGIFQESNATCVCGPIIMFDNSRQWNYPAAYKTGESLQSVFGRDSYNQPGTWFNMDAIRKLGYPDERLHYVMDKEWFMRYLLQFGVNSIVCTDKPLALYRHHEETKSLGQADKFMEEYAAVIVSYARAAGQHKLAELVTEKYDTAGRRFQAEIFSKPDEGMIHELAGMFLLRRHSGFTNEEEKKYAMRLLNEIDWERTELDMNCRKMLEALKAKSVDRKSGWRKWFGL